MNDKFDVPHGHSEQEVKKAGGKTGCPVCLRQSLKDAQAEIHSRCEYAAIRKTWERCVDKSPAWIHAFYKKMNDAAIRSSQPKKVAGKARGED